MKARPVWTVFLLLGVLLLGACARVPRAKNGELLYWVDYRVLNVFSNNPPTVETRFPSGNTLEILRRYYGSIESSKRELTSDPEALLASFDLSLSAEARAAPLGSRFIVVGTRDDHRVLFDALNHEVGGNWSLHFLTYQHDGTFPMFNRRFGLGETLQLSWDGETIKHRRMTSLHFGSNTLSTILLHPDLQTVRPFRYRAGTFTYTGPAWLTGFVLAAISAALLYFLRRPLLRILNLRRTKT